ncbi:MAG: MBL fold metallo-hydrolase [Pseudomonadota bacterium]
MTEPSIKQLHVGPMLNFAYLVGDDKAKACATIDPGWDANAILNAANDAGWKIEKILLTHTHFDHIGVLRDIAAKTDATIYVHKDEAGDISKNLPVKETEDGTLIELGSTKIKCIHTPGHTPGSQCFLVKNSIFTGDTLFVDGCGRVDLPGSDPKQMMASLKTLASLDPKTKVWPGHDYGGTESTIGELLMTNPAFLASSESMLL